MLRIDVEEQAVVRMESLDHLAAIGTETQD